MEQSMASGHFLQIFVVFVVVGIPLLIVAAAVALNRAGDGAASRGKE